MRSRINVNPPLATCALSNLMEWNFYLITNLMLKHEQQFPTDMNMSPLLLFRIQSDVYVKEYGNV
jgi:hypothetical protein